MGTNYTWRHAECRCCERYEELHIGKSSGGWEFMFRGHRELEGDPTQNIESWADWKQRIRSEGRVIDEYGTPMPTEEFIQMVEKHLSPGKTFSGPGGKPVKLLNHIDTILADPKYEYLWPRMRDPKENWKDAEGFSFGIGEFS